MAVTELENVGEKLCSLTRAKEKLKFLKVFVDIRRVA